MDTSKTYIRLKSGYAVIRKCPTCWTVTYSKGTWRKFKTLEIALNHVSELSRGKLK